MSERLYSWLLHLFPSDFRERFGEEAIQLFRDRFREEKSFRLRLRLWIDLMADLAISIPREHVRLQSEFPEVAHVGVNRGPLFQILKGGSPRFSAWFLGGAISVVSLAGLSVALAAVTHHPATVPIVLQQASNSQLSSPQQTIQGAQTESWTLDAAERARVIDAAAADVREHYVDREIGSRVADSLLRQERNGGYDGISDGSAFADLLTNQIRSMNRDMELGLIYSEQSLPMAAGGPTAQQLASYK